MKPAMIDPSAPGTPAPPNHARTPQHAAPGSTSADGELEALRSRLGRLLLADPVTDESPETAERIGRRAQQIRGYLESSRAAPAAPAPLDIYGGSRAAGMESPNRASVPSGRTQDSQSETARLIEALDAYLADPASAPLRSALEQTIEEVIGPLPDAHASLARPDRPRNPSNAVGSHRAPVESTPRVELHRLDEAERDWWRNRFEQLRRRVTVGLVLSSGAIIGLLALYLDAGHPWPSFRMAPDMRPPEATPAALMPMAPPGVAGEGQSPYLPAGMDALYQLLQQLGTTPEGLAAFVKDWSDGPAATLEALREHNAELDLKIMQLDARLSAWEQSVPTAATPRPRQSLRGDSIETDRSTDIAAQAIPAAPPHALDPEQPAFGIQLATLRSRDAILTFARRSGLDLTNLYVETAGNNQMLILGFYPSAGQAQSAREALPPVLQKSRPIVRSFQAPADLAALENTLTSPISDVEPDRAQLQSPQPRSD